MRRKRIGDILTAIVIAILGVFVTGGTAGAAEKTVGMAHPWEFGFQAADSPVMAHVRQLHSMLLIIIFGIVLLVLGLLAFIIFRFSARRNPVASKTAHHTVLEIVWTAVPIMILIVIAIPSIKLLYYENKAVDPELTLKVTGHQWYWTYTYPTDGGFSFDSLPIPDSDIDPAKGQVRLLSVDNPVVLPIGTNVQVLTASEDVIHSWAVPSLGVKKDAVPGRVNETWLRIDKEGTYYGQCSELCGVNHYFMPIEIHAVSKAAFAQWVAQAKQKFASSEQPVAVTATAAARAGAR
jgi:cytochrome c oxidase subunit 2